MSSKYPIFDRSRLRLKPLADRSNDLHIERWTKLQDSPPIFRHPQLPEIAQAIVGARLRGAARILMFGAHLLRAGLNRYVIDLMERGVISHLAMNGAGVIHDFELARIGATTESVARYVQSGEFGLWRETGEINDWVRLGNEEEQGLGEAVGKRILESSFPYRNLSVLAAAYRCSVPATVHVGIGYDITHEHPNFDGASTGAASYRDFLIFSKTVEALEGGVVLSFGSAVMAPEIFLKSLSMARNVAHQEKKQIRQFTTAVFDLIPIQGDYHRELARTDPGYYFRPYKTLLVRTVADGGRSFYICGDHRGTFPALWRAIRERL